MSAQQPTRQKSRAKAPPQKRRGGVAKFLSPPDGQLSLEELKICKTIIQTPSPYHRQVTGLCKLEGSAREEKAYQLILEEIHKRSSWSGKNQYVYSHALMRGLELLEDRPEPWSYLLDGLASRKGARWPQKQRWIDYCVRFRPEDWERQQAEQRYPKRLDVLESVAREASRQGDLDQLRELMKSQTTELHRQLSLHWPLGENSVTIFIGQSPNFQHLPHNPDFNQQLADQSCQQLCEVVRKRGARDAGKDVVKYLQQLEEAGFTADGQLIFELVQGVRFSDEELEYLQQTTIGERDLRQYPSLQKGGREAVIRFLVECGDAVAEELLLDLWERIPKQPSYIQPLIEHPAAGSELWERALRDWEQQRFSGRVFVEVPQARQHPEVRERLRASSNAYVLSRLLRDLQPEDFGLVLSRLTEEHPDIAARELEDIQEENKQIPPGLVDAHDLAELLSHPNKELREKVLRVLRGFEQIELDQPSS